MKLTHYLALLPLCLASSSYYFDGSATNNGDGTQSNPYNTLTSIPNLSLSAGDKILLKRGTSFAGPLVLNKSGSAGSVITVSAYGDASQSKPIVGAGTTLNSVLIQGASFVTVQDLNITNPGDNKTPRRGVYVYAADAGRVQDITLQRLYIHDVRGWMPSTTTTGIATGKYANASGGIVIEAAGSKTPTYFDGLLIQDNEIRSVDRQGIYTWSNWCQREELAAFWNTLCLKPWAASSGLVIQRNRLYDIGGDGIVITGNNDAEVLKNTLVGFNRRSESYNAGLWTANSVGSVFRYNTVSGGKSTLDGMAYDVDHSTSGTLFEYNVSHDNEGGFFLFCPYDKPSRNFTIRYNLSVNDRTRIFQVCDGGLVGGKIYKNTVYIGDGLSPYIVTEATTATLDVQLTNNIFKKDGSGAAKWELSDANFIVNNNAFYGSINTYSGATNSLTEAPGLAAPGLRDPKAYQLLTGYPTLDSATVVPGDADLDFFNNPTSGHANRGFYSGAGTKSPAWISRFDDSSLAGWTATGTASIVADPSGGLGKSLSLASGVSITRPISLTVPFRLNVRVWTPAGTGTLPSVEIQGVSKSATVKFAAGTPYREGEWQILEIAFSDNASTATVDGESVTLDSAAQSGKVTSASVKINGGSTGLVVDEIFVTAV
ncbi:Pectin lyase fold/virulence factor [Penicillium robsamsonii]|uniref:Pectin lyase fold/virulence factor n=1 Tax=Penicillium robsamsonii TaxID=1792511 RepID=UPI002548BEA4|nr:Pectin lyase fold/virulence factor [Penicillium robsamsonii]KAJ5813078.1 Pectin lyase fold/virulence factor [Penicillium robsamsonii]